VKRAIVRKLACILPLLLATAIAATTTATTPVKKTTRKPASKKTVKKVAKKRRPRVPVVAVSPQVRHVAFQAVSARATNPMNALEGAGALVPFFEQISRPSETSSLHILHYGDSHTASDDWAAEMRQSLQAKFGAGGPGFTLAGHPFAGYRRFDSRGNNSRGWYTDGLVGRQGDGIYGLSGVSLTAQSARQTVSLVTEAEQIELHYLQQPAGGQLAFAVDGANVGAIDTAGDLAPGIYRYVPSPGSHEYVVTTTSDAPVRLFGWVAQNHSGITYETLGINGAKAGLMLDWNQSILAGEMAARDPALIVVAYGTNEALSRGWTQADYRSAFTEVIHRLRAAAPVASILVVGPPDCLLRYRGSRLPFPHLDDVIEIQRQVAHENGCAFWDWRTRMGGPGSVRQWVQAGLSQGDYVHFTGAGYRLVGDMLFEELMEQYNRFLAVRAEATNGQ
jgi:lysophospholipase L1-like esterase